MSAPSISFSVDTNTGMYRITYDWTHPYVMYDTRTRKIFAISFIPIGLEYLTVFQKFYDSHPELTRIYEIHGYPIK